MLHPAEAGLPTVGLGGIVTSVGLGMEGPQHLVGPPLVTIDLLRMFEIRCAFSHGYVLLLCDRCSRKLLALLFINSLATVVSHEYLLELLGYKYMHSFVIIVLLQA